MKLAMGLLIALSPALAGAQQTGWEAVGKTLGSREGAAMQIVQTSTPAQVIAGEVSACLKSSVLRLASPNESVAAIAAAAKNACAHKRSEFYSAVYNENRAELGNIGAIRVANNVLARYDAAIDAGLPEDVILAKQRASSTSAGSNRLSDIRELKMLLDSGALSQEEFESEKRKILEGK
jgi:hypothetical protein